MMTIKPLLLLGLITQSSLAWACTPQPKISNPPKLINGHWVEQKQPSQADWRQADLESLKRAGYDFVFSGTYRKEISFSDKRLSYIESKKIWHGKVPKSLDLDSSTLPEHPDCKKLKYDQDYIFFGVLGGRSQPIRLKTFRTSSSELQAWLGQPEKQWLRGRLIQHRK